MEDQINNFREYRQKMNDRILEGDNKVIKRIFNLDTNAYQEGALSETTKELIGLTTSLVLKCDDCVFYHLQKCFELGVRKEQIFEAFSISNLVGGTIIIPHMRRAVEFWEKLENEA
jgi:AhpD family alkylhydroperoxidase